MNCDRIAPYYKLLEYLSFGLYLQRTRTYFLPHLQTKQRILLIGDGDGRFLAQLLNINPTATIDSYDLSAGMILGAKSRITKHQVNFYEQDITTTHLPNQTYDAIVANFFFDCFNTNQLTTLIASLKLSAQPDCLWFVSDFQIPIAQPAKLIAILLTRFLYLCFALTTGLKQRQLPNYHQALTSNLLNLTHRQDSLAGILTTRLYRHNLER